MNINLLFLSSHSLISYQLNQDTFQNYQNGCFRLQIIPLMKAEASAHKTIHLLLMMRHLGEWKKTN